MGADMAANSKIEWTESTWNPVTGCTKVSSGCKNCYAERMAYRLQAMGQPHYKNGFKLALHEDALDIPLRWKKPKMIFVNSMSDLFHKDVPFEFIQQVFEVMGNAHWHTFQVLTKRSERLRELSTKLKWAENIWMGVSIENNANRKRMDDLAVCNSSVKFLSLEPLLGPLPNLELTELDWVIVGGESGPGARVMKEDWVTDIRNQCVKVDVPFFFKQWGGVQKKKNGRLLEGFIWNQIPETASLLYE
jgi:protein gp37